MSKQRNMSQIKEQDKNSKTELNKIEESNLPDTEFKTLTIRLSTELKERIDELFYVYREMVNIKKNQSEIKNIITEMKNILYQWSPTFLASGTGFMEDNFSTDWE